MAAPAREAKGSKFVKKNASGSYGLSAELKRKQDAKYDHRLEAVLRQWIEDTLGKTINADFHKALKSGVNLCRLMNKIQKGSIKRISKSKMPFSQMENINAFLTACRKRGIPEHSCFSTVDLFEAKNMGAVLITLDCLRKKIGGRKAAVKSAKHKMGNLTGFDSSINDVKTTKIFDRMTGGADAVAGRLEADRDEKSSSSAVLKSPGIRRASAASAKRRSRKFADKDDGYDGSYGLSAEVKAKMDAKYDFELEEVIQEWIEDTLNIEFENPFAEELQSGIILCQLINEIEGKQKRIPMKKISKSKSKFAQMGNINLFLHACREYGISETGLFSTVDLHEQKNMMAVLITLDSLRRGVDTRKEGIKKKVYASHYDPSIRKQKGTEHLDKINKNVRLGGQM